MSQPPEAGGLGAFLRNSGYLRKWLILGIAIGVIAPWAIPLVTLGGAPRVARG